MSKKILHIFLLIILTVQALFAQRHPEIPEQVTLEEFARISEPLLQHFENIGYPFAALSLQRIDETENYGAFRIRIDTGQFIVFDTLVLKGDVRLSKNYLYAYLGIRPGMPYSERLVQSVRAKLAELPFATVVQEPGIAFVRNKAQLYIYLNQRRTSQFDGYVGLVPVDEKSGRVSVQGEVTLALQNLFKIGESITMNWHSSEKYSQYLQIAARLPHIYRSRFGVNGSFLLDKQDTTYLTLNYHIGIPYAFHNNCHIEPYFDQTTSTLLSAAASVQPTDTSCSSFRKTLYGLEARYRKLDYLFNPRKGIDISIRLSAGHRKRLGIASEETANTRQTAYHIQGQVVGYIPIGKHFVIVPALQAGSLLTGPHYYNELFKIGGEGLIRGFNSNDLCASTYLLYSGEVRYLFAQRSYANLFFDGGTYEQQLHGDYHFDTPFGFGAGLHLAVKTGTFYLEYALGRQMGNPISFKTGKIHFGIKVEF